MLIEYQIFSKEKLLIVKYIGEFDLKDYRDFVLHFVSITNKNEIEFIVSDFRETTYSGLVAVQKFDVLKELFGIRKNVLKKGFYNVMLVTSPNVTANIMLYIRQIEGGFKYGICYTLEKVISLLSLKWDVNELGQRIENLENRIESSGHA